MGGTPLIELYVMYNEVAQLLGKAGITVARSLVGNYITSLEMAGCSVTLLKVDDELVASVGRAGEHPRPAVGRREHGPTVEQLRRLAARCTRPSSHENAALLTELDSAIGDADHGTNMDRGMTAIVAAARRRLLRAPPTRCSRRSA